MVKTALLLALLMGSIAFAEEAPAVTVAALKRTDGREAFRVSDGKTEAVVVPSLGRVMQYGPVGGANWLWIAPADKVDMNGWKNFGGEKVWVSPQSTWPAYIGRPFPPDESWESGHEARVLDNPPRLQTTSPVSKCGVRIIREFSFNGSGEFVTSTTLEKMDDTPLIAGAWTVTQIPPPDAVFLPTSEASVYKNNVYKWSRKTVGNITNVTPSLIRVIPTTGGAYKIGVDAPVAAIAAVRNGVVLLQRTERTDGKYPDGPEESGFPVELFDLGQADRHYLELELLSPVSPMAKGKRITFTVRWSLHSMPSQDVESAETSQSIDTLFRPPEANRERR
ncbi:MAG: hypothetical protein WCT04_24465 [Planctomycetota bacterium]